MESQPQHFVADFLWKVSLKILNSGLILKTFTHEPHTVEKLLISDLKHTHTHIHTGHMLSHFLHDHLLIWASA